jgi:hypothetical protein
VLGPHVVATGPVRVACDVSRCEYVFD